MDELYEIYKARAHRLDRESILKLNEYYNQGEINNVVTGLEERFYSLSVTEDEEILKYNLIFGTNKDGLNGFLLELDNSIKERDELLFMFSKSIVGEYDELNIVDVFNAFQRKIRTIFEYYGFITYNPSQYKDISGQNLMIAKGVKGFVPVLEIEKKDFYKDFFDFQIDKNFKEGEEHVYLMYNTRNDLIKIGQSKHPNSREKTLQSEEPEIVLLAMWQAPKSVEKELHKKFSSKRKRGEWFHLSFNDLEKIKTRMSEYL